MTSPSSISDLVRTLEGSRSNIVRNEDKAIETGSAKCCGQAFRRGRLALLEFRPANHKVLDKFLDLCLEGSYNSCFSASPPPSS